MPQAKPIHALHCRSPLLPRLHRSWPAGRTSCDKAIQAAEARAAEFPEIGSPFKYGTRRIIPKKFKFSLVYVATDAEVIIRSFGPVVAHCVEGHGLTLVQIASTV